MSEYDDTNTEFTLLEYGPTERAWKHAVPLWKARARTATARATLSVYSEMGDPIPTGPWDDEPDKVQWVDPLSNLDCLAVRNFFGAWCGYVGVTDAHPFFGKDYDEVPADVHGGLTFASSCDEEAPEGFGICHAPFPGRSGDVWWFGFDCGHAWDLMPGMEPVTRGGLPGQTYRDLAYVKNECASLAHQLKMLLPVTDVEVKEVFGG